MRKRGGSGGGEGALQEQGVDDGHGGGGAGESFSLRGGGGGGGRERERERGRPRGVWEEINRRRESVLRIDRVNTVWIRCLAVMILCTWDILGWLRFTLFRKGSRSTQIELYNSRACSERERKSEGESIIETYSFAN